MPRIEGSKGPLRARPRPSSLSIRHQTLLVRLDRSGDEWSGDAARERLDGWSVVLASLGGNEDESGAVVVVER